MKEMNSFPLLLILSTLIYFPQILFSHSTAYATSFYIRPFSEVTQTVPNMVYGTIRHIHTDNGTASDGGKTIYTFSELVVKEVIKGNIHQSEIVIRKLGGTKDGVTLDIPSSVEFTENEETVVFLGPEMEDHSYEVEGMETGKFSLKEENGEKILVGGLFEFSRPDPDGGNVVAENLKENLRPWSLTQLKELIHQQTGGNPTPAAPLPSGGVAANHLTDGKTTADPNHPSSTDSGSNPDSAARSSSTQKYLGIFAVLLAALAFFYFRRK